MANPAKLVIEFEATGRQWENVESFSITEDFLQEADAWDCTVYGPDPRELRRLFVPLSPVKLYVDGALQVVGRIQTTEGTGGNGLIVTGLDYFGDIVASGIDPSLRITSQMSLADSLLAGLGPFGIDEIETKIDEVRRRKRGGNASAPSEAPDPTRFLTPLNAGAATIEDAQALAGRQLEQAAADRATRDAANQRGADLSSFFTPAGAARTTLKQAIEGAGAETPAPPAQTYVDEAKPEDGEGAIQWAQRLCMRSGYSLQPGSKRTSVAVVRPDYSSANEHRLVRTLDGVGQNVQMGKATRNWGAVPTAVSFRSRKVATGQRLDPTKSIMSPWSGSFGSLRETQAVLEACGANSELRKRGQTGDARKLYRPVWFKDGSAKSDDKLQRATQRFLAERLRETLTYTCTIASHRSESGSLYTVNSMASTNDEIEDVDESLWIHQRTLRYSGGESTELRLIRPASYVL